jgi:GNAT superfamily N-acetyltransferase
VLFSEAFTERYRRDGLVGVRVPALNPAIWRYAIDDAHDGAMLWRDASGHMAAFNIAHRSGVEGWMGPLAVRDDCQGAGNGQLVVRAGIDVLQRAGCSVIGLETMPRTMDNIGFYAGLGFVPTRLTITLTVDAEPAPRMPRLLGSLSSASRGDAIDECRALVQSLRAGYDYTREIELTHDLALGDTLLVYERDALVGFALCHAAPLVEGRSREELRVLKLVMRDASVADTMITQLADFAGRWANMTRCSSSSSSAARACDGPICAWRSTATRSASTVRASCCRTGRFSPADAGYFAFGLPLPTSTMRQTSRNTPAVSSR